MSPILEEGPEEHDEASEDFLADLKGLPSLPPPDDALDEIKAPAFVPTDFEIPPPSTYRKRRGRKPAVDEFGDLFGDPTPILGKTRREQLTRLHEFKALFPNELKSFKIKPKATEDEIEDAIRECETIVSCGGIQNMLNEALLTAIQVVEGVSSKTSNFDISGTAAALRQNPEFYRLCKLCWIKYKVFSKAPPEMQLALVIGSTALMMRAQNVKKAKLGQMLNTPLS